MGENLSFNNDKLSSPDVSMQSSSAEGFDLSRDQRNAGAVEQINPIFHADSTEFDSRAKRALKELRRFRDSRTHNRPLLLDRSSLGRIEVTGERQSQPKVGVGPTKRK